MTVIDEFAPAKVNLTLEVLGKRPDGHHELASLVAFADAGDRVRLDVSKPAGVTVSGPFGESIAGPNLIDVTLKRVAVLAPLLKLGAVHLEKNLPVAAGIGGGSADAAAVLRAIKRANVDAASRIDWMHLAAALGSDVPVCFESRACWMTGRGEHVDALPDLPQLYAVLVNPLVPMPADKTAQVFSALNVPALSNAAARVPPPGPFPTSDAALEFIAARGNALETVACAIAPVAGEIKSTLLKLRGCRYAAVSGGGPTCFGLFESAGVATRAAAEMSTNQPNWWVLSAILR